MKLFLLVFLLPAIPVLAQSSADSIKKSSVRSITSRFPSTRFIDLQYEQFNSSAYDSQLDERAYEKGTLVSQKKFRAAVNFPLIKKERWILSTSLRYKFESFNFGDVSRLPALGLGVNHGNTENFHFYSSGVNFTYYTKLFGKEVFYNASLIAEGSQGGIERLNGVLLGSVLLKKTAQTTIRAGVLLQSSNTALSPVIPTFSLEHHFLTSRWSVDFVLPKYFYMRRPLLENGRLSIGTALDSESFFVYPQQKDLKATYQFNRSEIKSGVVYEYALNKQITASFRAGLNQTLTGNLRASGEGSKWMTFTQKPNGYFNIGLSFNPFQK